MKPSSPQTRALLATRQFFLADLVTFELAGPNAGTKLRFTTGPVDLRCNGHTYSAGGQIGPYFNSKDNRATGHQILGLQEDSLSLDCFPGTYQLFGAGMRTAMRYGLFDGAVVTFEHCFMPLTAYGDTSRGTIRWFVGRVANIDFGRSVATFSIKSHLELLNQQFPRNLIQAGCPFNLGDASCGATVPTTTGTVASGTSTTGVILATLVGSFAAGTFDLGKITFTSGVANGLVKSMKTLAFGSPDIITLQGLIPAAPSPGDTFIVSYGCDKSLGSNGCAKFSNIARYGGFPYVPQPIVAA